MCSTMGAPDTQDRLYHEGLPEFQKSRAQVHTTMGLSKVRLNTPNTFLPGSES